MKLAVICGCNARAAPQMKVFDPQCVARRSRPSALQHARPDGAAARVRVASWHRCLAPFDAARVRRDDGQRPLLLHRNIPPCQPTCQLPDAICQLAAPSRRQAHDPQRGVPPVPSTAAPLGSPRANGHVVRDLRYEATTEMSGAPRFSSRRLSSPIRPVRSTTAPERTACRLSDRRKEPRRAPLRIHGPNSDTQKERSAASRGMPASAAPHASGN